YSPSMDDLLPPERPPRRPGQEPSAQLTLEAYQRLRRELEELRTEGRRAMGERLLRAREHGDIRENAEYDAAKDAQGLMEARIRRLEHMIKNAVVRETPATADVASPGVIVTIKQEGEAETED